MWILILRRMIDTFKFESRENKREWEKITENKCVVLCTSEGEKTRKWSGRDGREKDREKKNGNCGGRGIFFLCFVFVVNFKILVFSFLCMWWGRRWCHLKSNILVNFHYLWWREKYIVLLYTQEILYLHECMQIQFFQSGSNSSS